MPKLKRRLHVLILYPSDFYNSLELVGFVSNFWKTILLHITAILISHIHKIIFMLAISVHSSSGNEIHFASFSCSVSWFCLPNYSLVRVMRCSPCKMGSLPGTDAHEQQCRVESSLSSLGNKSSCLQSGLALFPGHISTTALTRPVPMYPHTLHKGHEKRL